MTTRGLTPTLVAALSLAAATAHAGSALPGFTLAAQTSRVSYYTRDGLKVDVKKTERYLDQLERELGVKVERHASLYRYEYPEQVAALTGQYAAGLTQIPAGRIHETEAFQPHELVHWVAGQLGDPGPFFHEGLAVALSSGGRWRGRKLEDVARRALQRYDLSTIVTRFRELDPEITYPVAGAFVKHLIDQYGMKHIAAFFRSCGGAPSRGLAMPAAPRRDTAFDHCFGVSLDDALEQWAPRS